MSLLIDTKHDLEHLINECSFHVSGEAEAGNTGQAKKYAEMLFSLKLAHAHVTRAWSIWMEDA